MATQTSLVAQQVRIRQWAEQIRNCQNRPKGMDVETWCTQNNLTKANYYYRLRRVRQICLDQMQDTETTAFVELPAPAPDPKKTDTGMEYTGTAVLLYHPYFYKLPPAAPPAVSETLQYQMESGIRYVSDHFSSFSALPLPSASLHTVSHLQILPERYAYSEISGTSILI